MDGHAASTSAPTLRSPTCSVNVPFLGSNRLLPRGLQLPNTEHRVCRVCVIPALAMLQVCCSMASWMLALCGTPNLATKSIT